MNFPLPVFKEVVRQGPVRFVVKLYEPLPVTSRGRPLSQSWRWGAGRKIGPGPAVAPAPHGQASARPRHPTHYLSRLRRIYWCAPWASAGHSIGPGPAVVAGARPARAPHPFTPLGVLCASRGPMNGFLCASRGSIPPALIWK